MTWEIPTTSCASESVEDRFLVIERGGWLWVSMFTLPGVSSPASSAFNWLERPTKLVVACYFLVDMIRSCSTFSLLYFRPSFGPYLLSSFFVLTRLCFFGIQRQLPNPWCASWEWKGWLFTTWRATFRYDTFLRRLDSSFSVRRVGLRNDCVSRCWEGPDVNGFWVYGW
jgi:hypothetical protein